MVACRCWSARSAVPFVVNRRCPVRDRLGQVALNQGAAERILRSEHATSLIVVAPPRTLAELRSAVHADVRRRIIAELEKDLTKHPLGAISKSICETRSENNCPHPIEICRAKARLCWRA
ncbi:host attachment protein [Bradyrhizobium liaoningense]|uniref:baeRF12 domain-containing protein n=1 Tax=Bradyrhizobium liaoningense TaxID=43992 RepID=UPI001BAAEFB8|nr:host attachment protein [Bradyrhizobium liaoningense]MBR0986072.1 host attachment protein [Bradyrhizobium liaoningense]